MLEATLDEVVLGRDEGGVVREHEAPVGRSQDVVGDHSGAARGLDVGAGVARDLVARDRVARCGRPDVDAVLEAGAVAVPRDGVPAGRSAVPFSSTPSPPNCWPSMPLDVTVESLSVVPVANSESKSPARALSARVQRLTVTAPACLIQMPMPPRLVTRTRSSITCGALSIATPWLAFARTLTPRTTSRARRSASRRRLPAEARSSRLRRRRRRSDDRVSRMSQVAAVPDTSPRRDGRRRRAA